MGSVKRAVLTLRFRNNRTHRRLKHVSDLVGTSMNEIAETAIERELDFLRVDLEEELLETVSALRGWEYSDVDLGQDLDAFARGEALERDPLRSTMVSSDGVDTVGIREIFADPLEQ